MATVIIASALIAGVAKLRQEKKDLSEWLKDLDKKLGQAEADVLSRLEAGHVPEPGGPLAFAEDVKVPVRPAYKEWIAEHLGQPVVDKITAATLERMVKEGRDTKKELRISGVH